MAKTVGFPSVAEVARATGVPGGKSCLGPPALLSLWESIPTEWTPLAAMSGVLALRAAAELGCWAQVLLELPWCLGSERRYPCCGGDSGV